MRSSPSMSTRSRCFSAASMHSFAVTEMTGHNKKRINAPGHHTLRESCVAVSASRAGSSCSSNLFDLVGLHLNPMSKPGEIGARAWSMPATLVAARTRYRPLHAHTHTFAVPRRLRTDGQGHCPKDSGKLKQTKEKKTKGKETNCLVMQPARTSEKLRLRWELQLEGAAWSP